MHTFHHYRFTTSYISGRTRHRWFCSCGKVGPRYLPSKTACELAWFTHAYPDLRPPRHFPMLREGGFGSESIMWDCDCGESGRPDGHADERRAYQSHGHHVHSHDLKWYAAQQAARLEALSPEAYLDYTLAARRFEDRPTPERAALLAADLI